MNYGNLNYLRTLMEKEVESGYVHGAAIRVIHKDKVVYEDELGFANKEKAIPISKDTIYHLYSMSKPVTSAAAMILYERGELDLLSPVSDYLEGFQNQKVLTQEGLVDVKRPVTIQDLLNMTSGIVYPDAYFEAGRRMEGLYETIKEECRRGKAVDTLEFCNRIGREPLEFQPGERWRYGASADVLGAVIEVVSGKRLSEFMKEEIFLPLDMKDTGFSVPREKWDRFAELYEYIEEKGQLEPCKGRHLGLGYCMEPPAFESGGAGLVSSLEDYAHFAGMLAGQGTYQGVRLLGPKTVEFMTKPRLSGEQAVTFNWESLYGYNYGALMRIMTDPEKASDSGSVGEFGWDGWSGNYFFVDPKENLVVLYMIQRCGGGKPAFIRRLRSVIYGAI